MTDREKLIEMLIESGNIGNRRNHKCIYQLVKNCDKSKNETNSIPFAAIAALYFLIVDAERVLKERERNDRA